MDVTFKIEDSRFNYRVCAVIIYDNKILAMKDNKSPYFYLPGGRVHLHETAENAVLREIREELNIEASIFRALWLNQSFFISEVSKEKFHEICLYYLINIENTSLLDRGEEFSIVEEDRIYNFKWVAFENIKNEHLYPNFIKERIFNLPQSLDIIFEFEY